MKHTYDLVGIGIGPFNLGLAALSDPLPDVDAVFLDQAPEFRWHPGMMLDGATIQVPFLADLVTMADPTSPYSFLNFLKHTGRLYPFYVRESFFPLRAEYDQYCRWVADRLGTLRWGRRVTAVVPAGDGFEVTARTAEGTETYSARHVVLGVGTSPRVPEALRGLVTAGARFAGPDGASGPAERPAVAGRGTAGPVVHTADYLPHRDALAASGAVTVVGSGQSAAEVYRDLLDRAGDDLRLDWVTRSPRFFPMEYTKLTLEMTSPEYTDHFHALPAALRDTLGREQRSLYKGISGALVDDIHDALYRRSALGRPVPTTLLTDTEVTAARRDGDGYVLTLRHNQLGTTAEHRTRAVVVATGYGSAVPAFLDPVRHLLNLDERGRFAVARDYTVDDARRLHVVNAEDHTHGITAPDLGMGPWRSSVILAGITGREVYPVERRIAFQTFGLPGGTPADGKGAADDAPSALLQEVAR